MRIVRRASVFLSVALIVATVVVFLVRTAELERARDLELRSDAQVGAAHFAALVDEVTVAARIGRDPAEIADALVAVDPTRGVCAVDGIETACTGTIRPPDAAVAQYDAERRRGAAPDGRVRVTAYDGAVVVEGTGPRLTVLVVVRVDVGDPVFPSTYLPQSVEEGEFFEDGRVRQVAVAVPGVSGVYVVATGATDVDVPSNERRLYAIVFALGLVLLVLAGVTLVVEHRQLVERATFDQLTRLPNRGEFVRRAEELLDDPEAAGVCLLLFDLDGFKDVNDTYGHSAGDELLRIVGERLRRAVRRGDLVGRWGGDEFVVLLRGVDSAEMGSRRARDLAADVGGRTRLDGVPDSLRVKASVGVALQHLHGHDLTSLVEAADHAMYQAKRRGLPSSLPRADRSTPTVG